MIGEAYQPRSSGLLRGGLKRHRRRARRSSHFPALKLSDTNAIKTLPDFDAALTDQYSRRDLMLLTEKMLLLDPKPPVEDPMFLTASMYLRRARREIFVGDGVPDPAYVSGLYNRTHPQGLRWATPEQRDRGSAFYPG